MGEIFFSNIIVSCTCRKATHLNASSLSQCYHLDSRYLEIAAALRYTKENRGYGLHYGSLGYIRANGYDQRTVGQCDQDEDEDNSSEGSQFDWEVSRF